MRSRLDANAVTMFVAVVDEGSFVGASRALGIPLSTVSRKLAELEDALSVLLLRRTTRRVTLTQAGRDFYEQSKPIAVALEAVQSGATVHEQEPSGLLRITSSPLLADLMLREPIAEFLSRYPRVEIELFLATRMVHLLEEGFDVALRASELEDSSLVARRFAPSIHEICATPDYLKNHPEPKHPRDLGHLPCFVLGSGIASNTWRFEHAEHGRTAVTVHGPIRTNDLRIGLEVVKAGRAIGNFPTLLVGEAIRKGDLVRLLPHWTQPHRFIHALYPSRRHVSITLRTFLDFMSERLVLEGSTKVASKRRSARR